MYIRDMLAASMNQELGVARNGKALEDGIENVDYYISIAEHINYDSSVNPYENYSLPAILSLAKAVLMSARARKESRGSHYRSDFPKTDESFGYSTLISFEDGEYRIFFDKEGNYES